MESSCPADAAQLPTSPWSGAGAVQSWGYSRGAGHLQHPSYAPQRHPVPREQQAGTSHGLVSCCFCWYLHHKPAKTLLVAAVAFAAATGARHRGKSLLWRDAMCKLVNLLQGLHQLPTPLCHFSHLALQFCCKKERKSRSTVSGEQGTLQRETLIQSAKWAGGSGGAGTLPASWTCSSMGSTWDEPQAASPCPPGRARPGLRAAVTARSLLALGQLQSCPPHLGTGSRGAEAPWWELPSLLASMLLSEGNIERVEVTRLKDSRGDSRQGQPSTQLRCCWEQILQDCYLRLRVTPSAA